MIAMFLMLIVASSSYLVARGNLAQCAFAVLATNYQLLATARRKGGL
jgi:hypothetical protein